MPKAIKMNPPISKKGIFIRCLNLLPKYTAKNDRVKVTMAITAPAVYIEKPIKLKVIPTANASMLVATPNPNNIL